MPRQINPNQPSIPPDPFAGNSGGLAGSPSQMGSHQRQRTRGTRPPQGYATPMPTAPRNMSPVPPMQNNSDFNDFDDFAPQAMQETPAKSKRAKKNKKTRPKQHAKQPKGNKRAKTKKQGNIFQRIGYFFRANSAGEIFQIFCEWCDSKYYLSILIAVIGILLGLLFNRYISVGFAFALVIFGWVLSTKNLGKGEYACYISGAIAFVIPYLF